MAAASPTCSPLHFSNESDSINVRYDKAFTLFNGEERPPTICLFSSNSANLRKIQGIFGQNLDIDSIRGKYSGRVSASESSLLLKSIEKLQVERPEIIIPIAVFQKTLSSLQANEHITSTEAAQFQSSIHTGTTLKSFEKETEQTQNVQNAISLAHHYLDQDSRYAAIYWLCEAKEYLGTEKDLRSVIDLDKFFATIGEELTSLSPFELRDAPEILQVIGTSVKKLEFDGFASYCLSTTVKIGECLQHATSIETVKLASIWSSRSTRINNRTLPPIAEALKTNTSIKVLDLADTRIGDEGVLQLIEAIQSNPHSKIEKLNLFCCGMTDPVATKLLDFFKENEQIKFINVQMNRGVSNSTIEKFETLGSERMSQAERSKTVVPAAVPASIQEQQPTTLVKSAQTQSNVPIKESFESETIRTQNAPNAISLAHHCLEENSTGSAIFWLCEAKRYLGPEKNIREVIDLDAFFVRTGEELESVAPFKLQDAPEILQVIRTSIKSLNFNRFTNYSLRTTERIGECLSHSTSIETVNLSSANSYKTERLNADTLPPIAEALKTNTSIKVLDLADTQIGDEGVLQLMEAIRSNPRSKLEKLNLFCCGMSNEVALKLLEFFKENEQIKAINIHMNNRVTISTVKAFEAINSERTEK
ncbi:MAG: hypothetical protein PVI40_02275 [Chlamydiota bacterium]|jgi:Ran GTPase-activating protein (RanGAP) involved in mRNA processing and transport